ncbi:hypothetical protein Scep_013242 [Stephania cephalantha]|uniref:Bulb-type lectin domain-containing protein n=1 Tax=Stephania cephalantha TaxID=152367 RepID=A0AAP0JH36_9MAGN
MFAGQLLTANKTLVSKERKFELGFFTPGNSKKYYIGIWFRQLFAVQKKKTIVWVANRNKPITINDSSSSELKLIENGQLVLMIMRTQIPIWSTDSTPSRTMNDSSVKAVLRDDGNLVILSSTNGNVLWESFDHPTHVHLPGARLGYNGLTKKAMKVTSWRNSEDPSDGIYSIELGPDKSFSLIWNGSQKFYNSGVWNGRFFSNIPEMQVGYGFMSSFGITSYENGSYDFIYLLSNKTLPFGNFLDTSGQSKASIVGERRSRYENLRQKHGPRNSQSKMNYIQRHEEQQVLQSKGGRIHLIRVRPNNHLDNYVPPFFGYSIGRSSRYLFLRKTSPT